MGFSFDFNDLSDGIRDSGADKLENWLVPGLGSDYLEDKVNSLGEKLGGLGGPGAAETDPFGQRPFLQDIYSQGQRLYNEGAGNTPSWITDQWRGFAGPNNPFAGTARGDYLNSNPYLDKMFSNASDAVTRAYTNTTVPAIRSSFGMAGGYNRGSEAGALDNANWSLGKNLNSLATDIYGGNYNAERGRQESAIGNMFSSQAQALGQSAGIAQDPWRILQNYAGVVGGPVGGGQPQQGGNPLGSAIGGGLAAFGATGNPWLGALGGLGGLLSSRG